MSEKCWYKFGLLNFFDINVQKESLEKHFGGSASFHKLQKLAKEMMRCLHIQNSRVMDFSELQVNHSLYNEGTIWLVNKWMGAKGMVFWA